MLLPDDFIAQVRQSADILSLALDYFPELKKAGATYKGSCPVHTEKTGSFVVTPAKGTCHCFGCGAHFDAISLVQQMEGVSFTDAVLKLASKSGITPPFERMDREEKERKAILHALKQASRVYQDCLAADSVDGKAYIESRMTPEMVAEFEIGCAPANGWQVLNGKLKELDITKDIAEKAGLIRKNENGRTYDVFWSGGVVFPIKSRKGDIIGFAVRRTGDEAEFKYINSPETPVYKKHSALFGIDKADLSSGEVFVVEGYLDLMQMWSAGIHNVVAACGTAFTADHIAVLKKYGVRRLNLMFDGDKAGIAATQKAITLAYTEEMKAMVYSLPEGQDPDDFFKTGKLEDLTAISGFEYLEQSGIELDGTMRELRRLERTEKALVYITSKIPAVAELLKKRGNLDELFSQDAIEQLQEILQA